MSSDKQLLDLFLRPVKSPKEMKNWIRQFLDIDLPIGHIDPDSNSSPVEAMYEAYASYRDDTCMEIPGFIWLSSRDSGKTLCGSILNVMLMVHFKAQIAHLAAVKKQSEKCIEYVNQALVKIKPILAKCGRKVTSESKYKIVITNEDGTESFLDVVTASLAGGNSQHCPVATYDEIDTLSKQGLVGYREAQMIPTRFKNRGPLIIKYSTRKFAFGVFEQEIQKVNETGEKLLRWNYIDITEHCPASRNKPDLPRVVRYVHKNLPLRTITEEQYVDVAPEKRPEYDRLDNVKAGCATCPLLPVCRGRLADRPVTDKGWLYKPIDVTISQFKKVEPDMAEAQLMCWKPSQAGLVYPRFDVKGNTLDLDEAFYQFTGIRRKGIILSDLIDIFHDKGVRFYGMVDWGYRHCFALLIGAILPSGEFWLFETFAMAGLEFPDMMENAKRFRDKYKVKKWFCDTAQPMFISSFRKSKMPCAEFAKDVMGGIECIRGQITDTGGRRRLKVLKTDENAVLIKGLQKHHFKLDIAGEPTMEPDDDEFADICDALRYGGQNLFRTKGGILSSSSDSTISKREQQLRAQRKILYENNPNRVHADFISQQIQSLAVGQSHGTRGKSEGGSVLWDFGGALPTDES